MDIWKGLPLFTLVCVGGLMLLAQHCEGCNEAVCASLVSKCMLLRSCECNMMDKANCTCCKDCYKCLSALYTDCCSCVGLCPDDNPLSGLYTASTVDALPDPIPDLFRILTEEESSDEEHQWSVYNYPAHLDLLYFQPKNVEFDIGSADLEGHKVEYGGHEFVYNSNSGVQNCTVAYHDQCLSLNKCRQNCIAMGSARFRWFHKHGCCECIGSTCLDFGKGEPLCRSCPPKDAYYYMDYYDEYTDADFPGEGNAETYKEDPLPDADLNKAVENDPNAAQANAFDSASPSDLNLVGEEVDMVET